MRAGPARNPIVPGIIPLFLILAATLGPAPFAIAGEESVVDGVVNVRNGAEPAQGIQTVNLKELWRVGGEDDAEMIFGVIVRILIGDEGNVYLLDSQLSQVTILSPDGELVKTLGREGDGPGEFRRPGDMCFLPDGTLGVLQSFPGKVIKLNLDDTPAGTWDLGDPTKGAFYIMRGLNQGGGIVVAGGVEQHVDQASGVVTRETFLSSIGEDGLRQNDYASHSVSVQLQNLRLDEKELIDGADRRFDVDADGRVIAAIPRNGYEVSIFGPDGALQRKFTRDYEPWQRNERAETIWRNIMETIERTQAPGAPVSWEKTEPDVEFLRVADDGTIWILNSRAMWDTPEGIFTQYDVFAPTGHLEKQVRVVCEGDPREDLLFFVGLDRAFRVTGFWDAALAQFGGAGGGEEDAEAEPMAVICYEVENLSLADK